MSIAQSDPIIAELRSVRDEHVARLGYDIARIFKDIRAMQIASGAEYVRYPARRAHLVERKDDGKREVL